MAKRTEYQIGIDGALTKALNSDDQILEYLVQCTAALAAKFRGNQRVFFYLKGGTAIARYLKLGGVPHDTIAEICERSDWDTQLVIDPSLPRATWFEEFAACMKTITTHLSECEKQLLTVLARQCGVDPGTATDLAKDVRAALAEHFGNVFLKACEVLEYGPGQRRRWALPWQEIGRLAEAGNVRHILEFNIQAHSRATLTSALFHPGQALDNLNSIATGRELGIVTRAAREEAEKTWVGVEEAYAAFDELQIQLVHASSGAQARLTELIRSPPVDPTGFGTPPPVPEEPPLEADLLISLPRELIERVCSELLSARPEPQEDQLFRDWTAVGSQESRRAADPVRLSLVWGDFGRTLARRLAENAALLRNVRGWCLENWIKQPAMVAALVAMYSRQVSKALEPELGRRLELAAQRVGKLLELYGEEPDPEDVAEALRRETERLAPFTLVSVEKGTLKAGSVVENMSIRDFYLFRLMIRCQLNNADPYRLVPQTPDGEVYDTFKQQFKFRAELLDVSVPRDDSLESAEQWVHVRGDIILDDDGIPVPGGAYLLDEAILLTRETLDKKSSSEHKLDKRLKRACLVAEVYCKELKEKDRAGTRVAALSAQFPAFAHFLPKEPNTGPDRDANLVVFMRVCEQLVKSYGMEHDLRMRADCTQAIEREFVNRIGEFLREPLTHQTFLDLMKTYAALTGKLHGHLFALGAARQATLTHQKLLENAKSIVDVIKKAFGNDPRSIRCGVVDEYAIVAHPDLPDSIKENAPLNVLTIVAYTSTAGAARVPGVAADLKAHIGEPAVAGIDIVDDIRGSGTLYIRGLMPSPFANGAPGSEEVLKTMAQTVFMKIRFVVDDNEENWVVPAHPYDLKAIVKHYRRSLPAYTEYTILNRKKELLESMEKFLTTY